MNPNWHKALRLGDGEGHANDEQRGVIFMILGTAIVPVMDAIAKSLGDQLSPLQVTWGRFLFQFTIIGIAILMSSGPAQLRSRRPTVHALRGLLLAVATACFFFSLRWLPLADAIAIFFVQPMLLTLWSALLLGEKIGWHRRAAVAIGFMGALLIIKPGSVNFTPASLLPLGAAFFYSLYIVCTRAVRGVDSPLTMQFTSGIFACAAVTLALVIAHTVDPSGSFAPQLPNTVQWVGLIGIGFIAALGHLLIVHGTDRAPASLLAPFGYVEIVAATLLGWLFFQDWPDAWTWLGIIIIVASGFYVFFRERTLRSSST